MINAIRDVAPNAFAEHPIDQSSQALTIVGHKKRYPLRKRWNSLRRIETEEHERFRRPILECSIGLQRRASHVCQPFSFAQVKFAPLQIGERVQAIAFHLPLHKNRWAEDYI